MSFENVSITFCNFCNFEFLGPKTFFFPSCFRCFSSFRSWLESFMLCKCFATCWDNDNFFLDLFLSSDYGQIQSTIICFGRGRPLRSWTYCQRTDSPPTNCKWLWTLFQHCVLETVAANKNLSLPEASRQKSARLRRSAQGLFAKVIDSEGSLHQVFAQRFLIFLKTASGRTFKNTNILSPKRREP